VFDGWKLVHNTEGRGTRPEYELYDFAADPLDSRDVAGEHPEVVADLSARLRAWRVEATERRLEPDDAAAQGLSAEELQRLRSLGYVQ
jgi:arylsulfatase